MSNWARAQEVLDEELGKPRGGAAYVYALDFHFHLREQVSEALQEHARSLKLRAEAPPPGVGAGGRGARLLVLKGTVPMFAAPRGGGPAERYNLPVALWLPPRFPLEPPAAFVVPAPDMVLNERCRNVDGSGRILSDYGRAWAFPGSNLRDFVQDLQVVFSNNPPLFQRAAGSGAAAGAARPAARPAPAAAAAAARPAEAAGGFHATNPLAAGVWSGAIAAAPPAAAPAPFWAGAMAATHAPPSLPRARPSPPPPPESSALEAATARARDAAARGALAAALAARLASSLDAGAAGELARARALGAELAARGEALAAEAAALQGERDAVDRAAHALAAANARLGAWLRENEPRAAAAAAAARGGDPGAAVVAADALSARALAAQAADLAAEDALAALDRALEAGALALEPFLRQVRAVARRQFVARAVSTRVAARQAAEAAAAAAAAAARRRAPEAAPSPPPAPAQLPIGDLWHAGGGILLNPLASAARRHSAGSERY
jgi:ESCRT-I complex subunit TSG101